MKVDPANAALRGNRPRRFVVRLVGLTAMAGTVFAGLGTSEAGANTFTPFSAGTHTGLWDFDSCSGTQFVLGAGEGDTFLKPSLPGEVVFTDCNVVIENLTITGGIDSSGAAGGLLNEGNLTLINVNITGNAETGNFGAGGLFNDEGTVTLENSSVTRNNGGSQSSCVAGIENKGTMTIEQNSVVSQNVCSDGFAGGILNRTSSLLNVVQSSVTNNNAGSDASGGGIKSLGTLHMSGAVVSGNTVGMGGGGGVFVGSIGPSSIATIVGGLVANNTANFGGGIDVENDSTLIMSGPGGVVGNSGFDCGGGIFISDGSGGSLTGTTIENNFSSDGGGLNEQINDPPFGLKLMGTNITGNRTFNTETDDC